MKSVPSVASQTECVNDPLTYEILIGLNFNYMMVLQLSPVTFYDKIHKYSRYINRWLRGCMCDIFSHKRKCVCTCNSADDCK
jgi:DNA polymerase III psi subunit